MRPALQRTSRRHFLLGAGGAALGIPLLPSLLPREVRAQAMGAAARERFYVQMQTAHGPMQQQFFGPMMTQPPTMTANVSGATVKASPLAPTTVNGDLVLSEALQAKASVLTPRMLGLLNVINGLDFPSGSNTTHNDCGCVGNLPGAANPTIDQVMAASASFYPTPVRVPAIVRPRLSFRWSNPASKADGVVGTTATADSNVKLFDLLFGGSASAPAPQQTTLAVDRVLEHAQSVLRDPRCSADCRARLTQYLDTLADVQRRLQASAPPATAARPTQDTAQITQASGFIGDPAQHVAAEKLWNDMAAAAFSAGISRIYVGGPNTYHHYTFGSEASAPWHDNVAHQLELADRRLQYSLAIRRQFEGVLLDLATKLDALRGPDGSSLLDRSLLVNSFEIGSAGFPAHCGVSVPVISIGNAGGYFRTGLSADYRLGVLAAWMTRVEDSMWSGLLIQQWLGMVLRSMGVPASEYAAGAASHLGYPSVRTGDNPKYTDAIWAAAGTDLPFLKA